MSLMSSSQINRLMNDEQSYSTGLRALFTEENADMFFDSYFECMSTYRLIVETEEKVIADISKIRKEGKDKLDQLRKMEESPQFKKKILTEEDKIELRNEKAYYNSLIEFDEFRYIERNGEILQVTPMVTLILNHRRFFATIEVIDRKIRSIFGCCAKKVIEVSLFPMIKMGKYTLKENDTKTGKAILDETLDYVENLGSDVKEKINNPV